MTRCIFVDPNSDFGRIKHRWPFIKEELPKDLKKKSPIYFCNKKNDFEKIIEQDDVKNSSQIIIVGDDKTFHHVVNCFHEDDLKKKTFSLCNPNSHALSILASLYPKTKNMSDSELLHWQIQALINKKIKTIDLGTVKIKDKKNNPFKKYFINSASGGITEFFVKEIHKEKSAYHSNLIFMKAGIQSFFNYKSPVITIQSGADYLIYKQKIFAFFIANGSYGIGGLKIAPKAKMNDGLLHCLVIPNLPWSDIFVEIPKLWQNKAIPTEFFKLNAKQFYIESNNTQYKPLIELDGVLYGNYPLEFSLIPKTLRISV